MKSIVAACLLISMIAVVSCSRKSHATKTPEAPVVTFAGNIKSIMEAKCAPCHIPAQGGKKLALDNYASVRDNIDDILRRIQLAPGERGYMPARKDPLPAEEIALIKNWKEGGTKE